MKHSPLNTFKRILRSPALVIGELVALAISGAIGAILPQRAVFGSAGFIALTLLTALTLAIVIRDQIGILVRSGATLRRTGSTVLHIGLLLIILSGISRALFSTEAIVDLVEGETLPPTATAWSGQFPGLLARPFYLTHPVTLHSLHESRYPNGSLRDLSATLSVGKLALNHDLTLPDGRLFLTSEFSPAALVEWSPGQREAALLDSHTRSGHSTGPNGLNAYLRASTDRSESIDVRIMRNTGLLYAGAMRIGQTLTLAGGETLTLHGLPLWSRLRGSRDASVWFAYLGFALILTGCVLLFAPPAGPGFGAFRAPFQRSRMAKSSACSGMLLMLVLLLSACGRPSQEQARKLVENYNKVVSEAYRRGDVRLIDPVVGPNEGKKLTGLIGVRLDMGLSLDSELLSLDVTDVAAEKTVLRVRTRERWHYRDRKIGTGAQVGEESIDSYEMVYLFTNMNSAWMMDEITFAAPPRVERKTTPWATTHGEDTTR